ncbi:MAG: pyrroline-5-carboxylate reductase [Calditrichales bacterium]|nr:MAG: pyrroline-5-carboxylate reductase [Calditrichales bacterium]
MKNTKRLAILGAGNIGAAIAEGLLAAELFKPEQIILTRRKVQFLEEFKKRGVAVTDNNANAVKASDLIIIAVEPQQIDGLLDDITAELIVDHHTIISVVTGVTTRQILKRIDKNIEVVRAMPNTAIAIRESMTCLTSDRDDSRAMKQAMTVFNTVGRSLYIEEELMGAATALGACGIAFFLRAIRAASQGGIEIGFNSDKALLIASQTAKGAAALLLENEQHPEFEIDKVTTPRGVTISGLNQMEHEGFSSAMIKGIVTSAQKAALLYVEK